MPKASDYNNGLTYKFVCNDVDVPNVYVGSTVHFIKRKSNHKSYCNNGNRTGYNSYVYRFIRANGGWDNWIMLKICDFPCNSKFELETDERRHMVLLHADLNKNIPTTILYDNNYMKHYYIDNKVTLNAKMKEYYVDNKVKIQEYRIENKEKLKEYQLKYRVDNTDTINEKCVCECGGKFTIKNKTRHLKSLKHCKFIKDGEV